MLHTGLDSRNMYCFGYRKSGHKNSLLAQVGRLFIARPSECKVLQNYIFYPK
jgi:hypothetical protein